MPIQNKAYIYRGGNWVLVGSTGIGAAIVSVPTPPASDYTGAFWINPVEVAGGYPVTDILASIRGQVIAPKAIDIDGPNTLYIGQNIDGTAKLTLRVDGTPVNRAITEEIVATEEWVLANVPGISSAVVSHEETLPVPIDMTPQAIEDCFAPYADGLHYFKPAGALVSITREVLQTTVVIHGSLRSVARIVKSDNGLPTTSNPSTLLNSDADGRWMKLTSDELGKPFGNPQTVDLFNPNMTGYATVDDLALKADKQNLAEAVANNLAASEPNVLSNWMRLIITSPDFQTSVPAMDHGHVMQDIPGLYSSLENMYTKVQVDAQLEAIKDFSIANDNNLLAGLTALQDVVANLGTVGTGQIDVLAAIEGAAIGPAYIQFPEVEMSPIQWKGGLALAPVKDGADYRLGWNDGKQVHSLFHSSDFTIENINAVIGSETLEVSGLNVTNGYLNFQADFALARDGSRLAVQEGSGPLERVAYLSDIAAATAVDLSGYAKVDDPAQMLKAKSVLAEGFAFTTVNVLKIHDTGEGYGPRLSYITVDGLDLNVDMICLKSDIEPLAPGAWKPLTLINGYLAGTPAPQYRVYGDTIEFRGQVKSNALLDVDTYVNIAALENDDKPSASAFSVISSTGTAAGAFATLNLAINRIVRLCPRLLPANTFDLNTRFVGVK